MCNNKTSKKCKFTVRGWKALIVIAVILLIILLYAFAVTEALPTAEDVKAWSTQEAIFYGLGLVAFVLLIKG